MIRSVLTGGIIICVWCMVLGCHREKLPLDKEEFTALLIDMHRIDGTLAANRGMVGSHELKNYAYYNHVFQKYGITRADFDSCMYYYSARNTEFVKIYEVIIDSLNRQMTSIDKVLSELKINDSVNYFPVVDTLRLDSVYTVVIDSIIPGQYKFQTTLKFDSAASVRNRRIHSFFLSEDEKDTLHVRDLIVQFDTVPRKYNWSQYTDSVYTRLVISYLDIVPPRQPVSSALKRRQLKPQTDKPVDLKKFGGQSWDNQLFRPYISQRTEKRLQQGLPRR